MAQRANEINLNVDLNEMREYKVNRVFASVHNSRKEAEIVVLNHRLRGVAAVCQNGLSGKYEVLVPEFTDGETRRYSQAEFKEVGAGIYEATGPSWDKGNLWTIGERAEDGTLILCRLDSDDLEHKELTASLIQASSMGGQTLAEKKFLKMGEVVDYVDGHNRLTKGEVIGIDHSAKLYELRNYADLSVDYLEIKAETELGPEGGLFPQGLDEIQTSDDVGTDEYMSADEFEVDSIGSENDKIRDEFTAGLDFQNEFDQVPDDLQGTGGFDDADMTMTASRQANVDDAPFYSEEPGADDDFFPSPEAHSETAYESENPDDAYDYDQNDTDVSGFEGLDEFDENINITEDLNQELTASRRARRRQLAEEAGLFSEDPGADDDFYQLTDDLQKQEGEEDQTYDDVEDEINQVGNVVDYDDMSLDDEDFREVYQNV